MEVASLLSKFGAEIAAAVRRSCGVEANELRPRAKYNSFLALQKARTYFDDAVDVAYTVLEGNKEQLYQEMMELLEKALNSAQQVVTSDPFDVAAAQFATRCRVVVALRELKELELRAAFRAAQSQRATLISWASLVPDPEMKAVGSAVISDPVKCYVFLSIVDPRVAQTLRPSNPDQVRFFL